MDVCDRAGFFQKNPHEAKMTQNGQNWPLKRVFSGFKESKVISFFWKWCKKKIPMVKILYMAFGEKRIYRGK